MIIAQIYKTLYIEMDYWAKAIQEIKKVTHSSNIKHLLSRTWGYNRLLDQYFPFDNNIIAIDETTQEIWDRYSNEFGFDLIKAELLTSAVSDPANNLTTSSILCGFPLAEILYSYKKLKILATNCLNPLANYFSIPEPPRYPPSDFDEGVNTLAENIYYLYSYEKSGTIDINTGGLTSYGEKLFYDSLSKASSFYAIITNLVCQRKENISNLILLSDPVISMSEYTNTRLYPTVRQAEELQQKAFTISDLYEQLSENYQNKAPSDIETDAFQNLINQVIDIRTILRSEGCYIVDSTINGKELHWHELVDVYYEYPSLNSKYKISKSSAKFKLPALYVKYAFPSQSNFKLTITGKKGLIKEKQLSYFDIRDRLPSTSAIEEIITAASNKNDYSNKENVNGINVADLALAIQEKYFANLFYQSRNLPGVDNDIKRNSKIPKRGIPDDFKKTFDIFCSGLIKANIIKPPSTKSCWQDATWLKNNAFLFKIFYIFRAYSLWAVAPNKAPLASPIEKFEEVDPDTQKTVAEVTRAFPIISYLSFGNNTEKNTLIADNKNSHKVKNHDKIGTAFKRDHLDSIPFDPVFALLLFNLEFPENDLKFLVDLNYTRLHNNQELQAKVGNIDANEYLNMSVFPKDSFRSHMYELYNKDLENDTRSRYGIFTDTSKIIYNLYRQNIEMHNKIFTSIGKIILDGIEENLTPTNIEKLDCYIAEHILLQINDKKSHVIKYLQSKCRKANIDNKEFNDIIKKNIQVKRTDSNIVNHLNEFIFREAAPQEISADVIRSAINLMPEISGNINYEEKENLWLHNFIISLMIQIRFISKIETKIPETSTKKISCSAVNKIVSHLRKCEDEPSRFKYVYSFNPIMRGYILSNCYLTMPNIFDVSDQALSLHPIDQLYIHLQDIIYYFVHIIFSHFYEIHYSATYHKLKDGSQHEFLIQLKRDEINRFLNNYTINSPIIKHNHSFCLDYFP